MFLSNLSSANEQKARKKTSTKKKTDNVVDDVVDPQLKRLRTAEKPVLYKNGDDIPRDVVYNFLYTCDKMMIASYNIDEIVMDSIEKDLGLNMAAVEFQRDILENNFQIEKDYGCRYLSMIPMKHEGDEELLDAAKHFMFTALMSYTSALKVRSHKYRADPSLKPKANVRLPKKAILEFFEGCNALMAMPETKEELRMIFKQTGQAPGPRVIEMQRSILVLMGYDPDFGVACLNNVNKDYPGDREIMGKMQLFASCAETTCMISTMSDEQKEAFFKQIPPLMHHFPHMWVMQQRMQQQQMMMQQQQMQQQQGIASSSAGAAAAAQARLAEIEALKSSGVLGLLSSPEGRMQVQELAAKVQASKTKVYEEVKGWNAEKKQDFITNVAEHPVLVRLMDVGDGSPLDKIKAFVEMSESDVDQMMTLALVVSEDPTLVQKSQPNSETGAAKMLGAVSGVAATLGSLMSFNKFGPTAAGGGVGGGGNAPPLPPPSMIDDHDHSHSHQHGPGCSHAAHAPARKDISSGASEAIDR